MEKYLVRDTVAAFGGRCKVYKFDNGYGASVVCSPNHSYGGSEGLWELAVLDEKENSWYVDISNGFSEN